MILEQTSRVPTHEADIVTRALDDPNRTCASRVATGADIIGCAGSRPIIAHGAAEKCSIQSVMPLSSNGDRAATSQA